MMSSRATARRLIKLAAEFEPIVIVNDKEFYKEHEVRELFEKHCARNSLIHFAKKLVRILERELVLEGWNSDVPMIDYPDKGHWIFGTAMRLIGRRLDIYRGFLDPVLSIPILERVPDLVARFLLTIDGGEDYLDRECHSGVGWHYHYLDRNKQRSDVILCWDTRWILPIPQSTPPKQRGLFAEKHAEAGKPFSARPKSWGERKRESMYTACENDLRSRNISEYRCAANKSEPVYPLGATLTPHSSSAATATPPPRGWAEKSKSTGADVVTTKLKSA